MPAGVPIVRHGLLDDCDDEHLILVFVVHHVTPSCAFTASMSAD